MNDKKIEYVNELEEAYNSLVKRLAIENKNFYGKKKGRPSNLDILGAKRWVDRMQLTKFMELLFEEMRKNNG